jgi:peptidoglycan/LPS O-acetylase OafA/YrhL
VISGFLITGQLFREIESTGLIGLLSFYARRIRRLLPAVFVVLACTLVLLVLVVPRVVWRENLRQIRAASAYLLNWQLVADSTDYLAADDSPTLVQHYWSLALEEQFYLVWPLLLLLALVLGVRLHIGLRASLVTTLAVTTVVSFAYSVRATPSFPAIGFFSTQSRAWEFALGGLIALAPAVRRRAALGRAVGWAGVGLVLGACVVLTQETSFPGWGALAPTGGAALVLAAGGVVAHGSVAHASTRRPMSWLGDHSYAIYLWHWPPIIALPWVLHGPLKTGPKIGILAATLLLAWLTKRYVEDPVRSGAAWRARRWASFSLATAGAAALVLATTVVWADFDRVNDHQADLVLASVQDRQPCFGAAAMVEDGCTRPFARPPESVVDFAAADVPPVHTRCQPAATSTTAPTWCRFGDVTSPRSTIALVGNSYAVQLVPLLLEWTQGQQVRILLAARTDCLGLSTAPVPGQEPDDPCLAWSAKVQAKLLATDNLSLVILNGHEHSDEYLTGQTNPGADALAEARRHVLGSLGRFADLRIPTLVVKHAPGTRPVSAPECVARSRAAYDPCVLPRGPVTRMDFLSRLASRHPGLTGFLSLDRYFCGARRCHAVIGGLVAYFDGHHISATYGRTLARYVGPRLAHAMGIRQAPSRHGS